LALGDDGFSTFKCFLVQSLLDAFPDLAKRIALFRKSQLRLLFDHFRQRKAESQVELTPDEFVVLADACRSWASRHRFIHFYKTSLVRLFQKVKPSLARKLAAMSADDFRELYGRVSQRRKR
jgi:hypothetical protein